MTETQWLECNVLEDVSWLYKEKLSDRKLRIFECAYVRQVWSELPDNALRQAIKPCEEFADGLANSEELLSPRKNAYQTYRGIGDIIADHGALAINDLCRATPQYPMGAGSAAGITTVLTEVIYIQDQNWHVARQTADEIHCRLFREVVGNPFREIQIAPRWKTSTVVSPTKATHGNRSLPMGTLDPTQFAVLADALEEVGCDNTDILTHCRELDRDHVRGCWVLDLLLGYE
ncbi:MAG: hypothetical protein ACFCD0_06555 [Gemmataceae bacterium]